MAYTPTTRSGYTDQELSTTFPSGGVASSATKTGTSSAPLPPPKEVYSTLPSSSSLSHQSTSGYSHSHHRHTPSPNKSRLLPTSNSTISDIDLAEAVRNSVQIRGESPSLLYPDPSRTVSSSSRRSPSPRLLPNSSSVSGINVSTSTSTSTSSSTRFQPGHGYSQSSPDMSAIAQPMLPSDMMKANNPFEQDEMESSSRAPPKITTAPTRQKMSRANTNAPQPPSPNTKTRVRRSMSSDSYALKDDPTLKEITAGQKKALEDKKGSKHADVIDTWDPTGLGSAMWHHSGPYDAAAPSRNMNQPQSRAPMSAFQAPAPGLSPTREKAPASQAPPTSTTNSAPPPPLPTKDESARRHSATTKAARRATGGGLTGQYSTSVPASGGYFPDQSEPIDEATLARKERQKERDAKRRALKAAWGIDEPEPFEAFGQTGDQEVEYFEERSPKPMKSPGLRLGLGPRTPPIMEDLVSPTTELAPIPQTGPLAGVPPPSQVGSGGVKRTKSLMQKIKTMVRTRSASVESGNMPVLDSRYRQSPPPSQFISTSASGNASGYVRPGTLGASSRSQSMGAMITSAAPVEHRRPSAASIGWETPVVAEEELEDELDMDDQFADAAEEYDSHGDLKPTWKDPRMVQTYNGVGRGGTGGRR